MFRRGARKMESVIIRVCNPASREVYMLEVSHEYKSLSEEEIRSILEDLQKGEFHIMEVY